MCTSIIAIVLTSSFALSRTSTMSVRDSQERGIALSMVQSQIELVRHEAAKAADTSSGVYSSSPAAYFCIDGSTSPQPTVVPEPGLGNAIPALSADHLGTAGNYPASCGNVSGLYSLSETYDTATKTFVFYARWDKLGGGRDQVQMLYRIMPGIAQQPALPNLPPPGLPPLNANCTVLANYAAMPGSLLQYYNLWDYQLSDWHVGYSSGHPLASIPFTLPTAMAPGTYTVWTVSKDDTYGGSGTDLILHYDGYNSGGGKVFQTSDTSPLPLTGTTPGPEGTSTDDNLVISQTVYTIRAEHHYNPGPTYPADDKVDSACFAYYKTG